MQPEPPGEITARLEAVAQGHPHAHQELLALVYGELHRLAELKLNHAPRETIHPTALVNEVYARLFGKTDRPKWENRRHFFWAAARAMRDILVERARRALALKRGGGARPATLTDDHAPLEGRPEEIIAVGAAVGALEAVDSRAAEVVLLRFFAGMDYEQIGQVLDISSATARRDWDFAKAWLHKRLSETDPQIL